jgi:cytochrome c
MRRFINALVFIGLASPMGFAFADQDLLVKKNCLACHSIDKRKYGPKLNEIAAKYAGDRAAEKKLARKIKKGGGGVWGPDVMPPQPQLTNAEALVLAKYVLSLKE